MDNKIAGCVILYNPDTNVVSNIATYYSGLDTLLLIDNSPIQQTSLTRQFDPAGTKIAYHWMGGNKGMAAALNTACRLAAGEGYGWLLTMDQDSSFPPGGLGLLTGAITGLTTRFPSAGIISPDQVVSGEFRAAAASDAEEVKYAMTSGNLLSLAAWRTTGPFEEKLFIDYVDVDYCLRLRKAGFRIIRFNGVQLQHSLGHFEVKRVGGWKIGVSNHNPLRRYYITRNKLYTLKKYSRFDPALSWLVIRSMIGDTLRILLFEKKKGQKMRAVFAGITHFITGRYGPYSLQKDPAPGI